MKKIIHWVIIVIIPTKLLMRQTKIILYRLEQEEIIKQTLQNFII